jgi:hypothetical protein
MPSKPESCVLETTAVPHGGWSTHCLGESIVFQVADAHVAKLNLWQRACFVAISRRSEDTSVSLWAKCQERL